MGPDAGLDPVPMPPPGRRPTAPGPLWTVTGLNDAKECAKDPGLGKYAMLAMAVLPIGKIRLLGDAADGVKYLARSTRAGRLGQLKNVVLKDGNPLGYEDSPGCGLSRPTNSSRWLPPFDVT